MDWRVRVGVIALALAALGRPGYLLWRLPAIWRGDKAVVGTSRSVFALVYARSYLLHAARATALWAGLAMFLIATTVSEPASRVLGMAAFASWLATVPLLALQGVINAFNRPKVLVAPPYRDEPGTFAERAQRRRRQRAGLPPTDHTVEILDVRSRSADFEAYLCALCSAEGCDWMAFPDNDVADEERNLRDKAARHTDRIVEGVVRPLD